MESKQKHHVVIIGGGFGGLSVAQSLRRADVRVTLIDRRNFHLFQPLLYQVATGGLSPANIAAPLRGILKRQKNTSVLLGEVTNIDPKTRTVTTSNGKLIYDALVIATGVRHSYFGNDDWEQFAPGLKTIEDATEIRRRILTAFEAAEREDDDVSKSRQMTFVVVGGGPTGVEMAGALGELSRHTLKQDFRQIDTSDAEIMLVEGADRILPSYPESLSERATRSLKRLGVTVRTRCRVTSIESDRVAIVEGEKMEHIATNTVFWAAGVQASPLSKLIAQTTSAELDRIGRVIVEPDCSVPGYPEIFVIGDLANFGHGLDQPLPGLAPVAIQQGQYVAKVIQQRARGETGQPFRYKNRGTMATIGCAAAVADIGGFRFGGFVAWVVWLLVHLMSLVGFENRLLVFTQWAWNYFTRNRAARLITGVDANLNRMSTEEPTNQ